MLLVARLEFLRAFGPGLAIAVIVAMLVAVTLIPAVLAIGGERIFGRQASMAADDHPSPMSTTRLAARHPVIAFLPSWSRSWVRPQPAWRIWRSATT